MNYPLKEVACTACFEMQRKPLWDDGVCLGCREGEYAWPGVVHLADLIQVDRATALYAHLSSLPLLEGDQLRVWRAIFHGTAREEDRDAFIASHDWVLPEVEGAWFGKLGERYRGVLVYTEDVIDRGLGEYGQMFLAKMIAADPDTGESCELCHFTGESCWVTVGEEEKADFTVKSHETYRGKKQTIVQRVMNPLKPRAKKCPK